MEAFQKRRTFAIIAHPDAGKTTLTEHMLLHAGAIHLAGQVKARGQRRRAQSDFMKIEADRGISVSSAVMTFEYQGLRFNLLDTPGHQDFSEDTYRTLTAVDSAIMVLDAAKGIEAQTLKLFEICRLRDIPILTFINKIDHEMLSPFELLDDIANRLALEVCPRNWPVDGGHMLQGLYNLETNQFQSFRNAQVDKALTASFLQEAQLAQGGYQVFDPHAWHQGLQTPIYFGSALRSFGVSDMLNFMARFSPEPVAQRAVQRTVEPREKHVTGFVFKMQANMDANHRDRVAFVRLCSGQFVKGMKLKIFPGGKTITVANPVLFFARERETVQEANAGDIIGIPNHGTLAVGDTLSEGEFLQFLGIPNFAPEMLRTIAPKDPMRTKHMTRALMGLAQEGVVHVFRKMDTQAWIVGVVGALQLDVLSTRMESEYQLDATLEPLPFNMMRWIKADHLPDLNAFIQLHKSQIAYDTQQNPVFMAKSDWELGYIAEKHPIIHFLKTQERV